MGTAIPIEVLEYRLHPTDLIHQVRRFGAEVLENLFLDGAVGGVEDLRHRAHPVVADLAPDRAQGAGVGAL